MTFVDGNLTYRRKADSYRSSMPNHPISAGFLDSDENIEIRNIKKPTIAFLHTHITSDNTRCKKITKSCKKISYRTTVWWEGGGQTSHFGFHVI